MQSSVQVLWVTIHHRSDYFELWGFVIWSIVRFLWTYKSCHCWKYPGRLDLRILQHIAEELWFGCGRFVNSWERLLWSGGNLKVENDKKITFTVSLILIDDRRRLRNNHYSFTKNLYHSQPWNNSLRQWWTRNRRLYLLTDGRRWLLRNYHGLDWGSIKIKKPRTMAQQVDGTWRASSGSRKSLSWPIR